MFTVLSPDLSQDTVLAKYSCFFVNGADRFDEAEPVDAAMDTDALGYAKQLLQRKRSAKAVEFWSQGEFIGRVDRVRT